MNESMIFRKYCKEHNMRYTPERDVIVNSITRQKGHFDVDKLFLDIRQNYPDLKLAKGSIYRTIPHLIRAGLIEESLSENGHVCYEHKLKNRLHGHLKCVKCGKILEFKDRRIDSVQNKACEDFCFKAVSSLYVINGYCKECWGKERS